MFMWLSEDGVISDDLYLLLYTVLYDSLSNTFLYDLVKTIELHFLKNISFGKLKENETDILLSELFRAW